jgi:glycerol kinase
MPQPDTKQRILTIAGELFARQGYTGTTIADIARELGTTTAALYYHFPSKAAILGGLLAGPLTAYTRLLDSLASGETVPEDLIGAIIDITADSRDLANIFDRDPTALAMIDEQLPRSSAEMTEQTIAALAGPHPDRAALIRANAALAVAKSATLAALELGGGTLQAPDRAEVLALAMRTLKDLSERTVLTGQRRPHLADFVGAVDQGTTSTRFMVFDHDGNEVARHQLEHEQILPRAGWVEHDPVEIWERTRTVVAATLNASRLSARDLAAVGIANQRETTVVWNRRTGVPYANAIVWQDTRTDRIAAAQEKSGHGDVIRHKAGLPPATYFSGGKLQWLLEDDPRLRADAERGDALFGTIDSWLLWHLTGGPSGGAHVTDVTNASRTMLMDLRTLDWDDELCGFFGVPRAMLPRIAPSVYEYSVTAAPGPFGGEVLIGGVLGDQQAATMGQVCFAPGEAKNTYGTGNFLVLNTGADLYESTSGLLTTIAYQLAWRPAVFALEGSVAVTGAAVQWLRDQLGIISGAADSENLARQVEDTAGLYFVPAFSGLFAPYWRADARGAIVGLSRFHTNAHLARATLEAICYQTRDVVEAMAADSGVSLDVLKVDGGVTANDLCMQLQADILGVPVSRPVVAETTALGAAYAAGLTAGFWRDETELRANWRESRRWEPNWTPDRREAGYAGWKKAIDRTLDWVDLS